MKWAIVIIIAFVVIAVGAGLHQDIKCRERGGVPHGSVCLAKSAVIKGN